MNASAGDFIWLEYCGMLLRVKALKPFLEFERIEVRG